MSKCENCNRALMDSQILLYENKAYKSCPECSKHEGQHVYYPCPEHFGVTTKRVSENNPMGLQSYCAMCRSKSEGPYEGAIRCEEAIKSGFIIEEIRFLPMSSKIFSTYEEVQFFISETMPARDGIYYFMDSKMNCQHDAFVLFQYGGKLVGYAVCVDTIVFSKPIKLADGNVYKGYYKFATESITLLENPIDSNEFAKIDPTFEGFVRAPIRKPAGLLPAIFQLINGEKGIKVKAPKAKSSQLPEEIDFETYEKLKEGAKKQVTVNAYERNTKARNACINFYRKKNNGTVRCEICGFEFGKKYGVDFMEKINVHHVVEIATIGEEYEVDPINDLLPVCPNCHLIIHSRKPAYTPDEVREMLKNNEEDVCDE